MDSDPFRVIMNAVLDELEEIHERNASFSPDYRYLEAERAADAEAEEEVDATG